MRMHPHFSKKIRPIFISIFIFLSFGSLSVNSIHAAEGPERIPLEHPKYQALIKELTEKHNFKADELKAIFKQVVFKKDIIDKFNRPAEHLPFYRYRKIFIKKDMIEKGRAYLAEHDKLLSEVEAVYGVEKEIIASILGVETRFGKPGIERYRAFDVLNTAFFLYPRREKFYRGEIISFLKLTRKEKLEPFSIKSSYAGAFGVPQFIPSSFLRYAVDFDKDGKVDLWNSKKDIFASVANYLKHFGWKKDKLLYLPAQIYDDSPQLQKMLNRGFRKTISVAEAIKMGVEIPYPAKGDTPTSFSYFEPNPDEKELIALFGNFRAITRYNTSVHYALVIVHLSRRLVL
ncbi:MAG: lytic murein transglycosylase [Nitrospirae bacterium]|nr:lytic murein transglycosylase [Candidatus Manganitrophaceae bacterium]